MINSGYCDVITTGRKSGKPHRVEVTFFRDGNKIYFLAHKRDHGGGTNWYQDLKANPKCQIEINGQTLIGKAISLESDEILENKIRQSFADTMGITHYETWYKDTERIPVVISID